MKHATTSALDQLEDVLSAARSLDGMIEKSRGRFYRGSQAFLHFHEDPAGLFADLKVAGDWKRMPVNTRTERSRFLAEVKRCLEQKA